MQTEKPCGEMKISSPFLKKLDNYWYHYKWHTIVAIFVLIAVLVCSLQICAKEEYDLAVIYAGPEAYINQKQNALDIRASLESVIGDRNGDGSVKVNFYSYWIDDNVKDTEGVTTGDLSLMQNTSETNKSAYFDEIQAGNVSIFLVDPALFWTVDEQGGFISILDVCPDIAPYKEEICIRDTAGRLNTRGVLLSATSLGEMPGLRSMPKDTILCLRRSAPLKSWFVGKSEAEKAHSVSVDCFRAILMLEFKEE